MKDFFPFVVDNTMLSEFKKCPLSYFRRYNQHLQGKESIHLIAGKAFAAGLEAARKSFYVARESEEVALERGLEELQRVYVSADFEGDPGNKSLDKMLLALEMYFMEWPMSSDEAQPVPLADGTYGIEYSFAIELPIKHPVYGVNLLFVGRADMLAEYAGKLYVEDEKTTSMFTKNTAKSWEMRSQFTGYCWALAKEGIETAGALVRGIAVQKTNIKFMQAISPRPEFMRKVFEKELFQTVEQMVSLYKQYRAERPRHAGMIYPMAIGDACVSYNSPCTFMDNCQSANGEKWLEGQEQYIWLPHEQRRQQLDEFFEENEIEG